MTASTILIVSDLSSSRPWWADLPRSHWKFIVEKDPASLPQRISELTPDLVVYDQIGNEHSPLDLITNARGESVIPFLLLTSIQNDEYLLAAYEIGVDECVLKPINPALLCAKLKAWLRHSWSMPVALLQPLSAGNILLTPLDRTLTIDNATPVRLTNLEFRLLYSLLGKRDHVMTAEELCHRVWLDRGGGDAVALKNIIYRIRRKIESDPHTPQYLRTVAGIGYEFVV